MRISGSALSQMSRIACRAGLGNAAGAITFKRGRETIWPKAYQRRQLPNEKTKAARLRSREPLSEEIGRTMDAETAAVEDMDVEPNVLQHI